MSSNIVKFDAIRSLAFGGIGAGYSVCGPIYSHQARIIHLINNTDGDIMVSFDGTTDNVAVIANSFAMYDFTANSDPGEHFRLPNKTQPYVKYITAPTTGTFYIVTVYGAGE